MPPRPPVYQEFTKSTTLAMPGPHLGPGPTIYAQDISVTTSGISGLVLFSVYINTADTADNSMVQLIHGGVTATLFDPLVNSPPHSWAGQVFALNDFANVDRGGTWTLSVTTYTSTFVDRVLQSWKLDFLSSAIGSVGTSGGGGGGSTTPIAFIRPYTSYASLKAVATVSSAHIVGDLAYTNVAGAPGAWQFVAGTTTEDISAGRILPNDYDAATNAFYWFAWL